MADSVYRQPLPCPPGGTTFFVYRLVELFLSAKMVETCDGDHSIWSEEGVFRGRIEAKMNAGSAGQGVGAMGWRKRWEELAVPTASSSQVPLAERVLYV